MPGITADKISIITDFSDDSETDTLELLHMHADVEPDGSSAMLSIHTSEGKTDMSITVDQMATTVSEMVEAGSVMMRRQLGEDKGRSVFEHMMRRAPRPSSITPAIDQQTGDVVVFYRFPDRLPFAVRMTQDQILEARAEFLSEMKRSSN